MLPQDSHVHTEWSWDTVTGSMVQSCQRALALGLPSVAFTEHADLTPWLIPEPIRPHLPDHFRVRLRTDGMLEPPALDVEGYLACVQECRERFPDLRILSGVELSEPHWHRPEADALLAAHRFERVLGSVHSLPEGTHHYELSVIADRPADATLRAYLGEVLGLVESTADFEVLAHIDYALRTWPSSKPFVAADFEEEFRTVLRALAGSGRAWSSTRESPCRATFSCGGPPKVAGSSPSAATPTHPSSSATRSPRPPRWRLRAVSSPAALRTTCGSAAVNSCRASRGRSSAGRSPVRPPRPPRGTRRSR